MTDYNIPPPAMPSEAEQKDQCLKHFESYLCQKYQFKGSYELSKALSMVRDYETECKAFNPFTSEFDKFDDRFTEANEDKLSKQLEQRYFAKQADSFTKAKQFLHECSSLMLLK